MKIDKAHSVYWTGKTFHFFILKLEMKDAFAVGIVDPEERMRRVLATFTGDEFSSFMSEIVKYCLDFPKVARAIPCPVDLTMIPHGCLREQTVKIRMKGKDLVADVKWDERLLEYHGVKPNEWESYQPENTEYALLAMRPLSSKALKERDITTFRIIGRNQAVKIQSRVNPALLIRMTMKKSMLQAIDEAMEFGLHMNRQDFIAQAIREKLNQMGIKARGLKA